MKKIYSLAVASLAVLLMPTASFAANLADGTGDAGKITTFMKGLLGFIDGVLIPLILGIAFLMFVWGVFKFFILGGADSEKQAEGKSLMIYAIAGFVLILSFYGIVNILVNGIGAGSDTVTPPTVPSKVK